MKQRPENFVLDYSSSLARGLVFAGLAGGNCRGSKMYYDSSSRRNHAVLTNMDPEIDWTWIPELSRWALDFDGVDDYITCPLQIVTSGPWALHTWCMRPTGGELKTYHVGLYNIDDEGVFIGDREGDWKIFSSGETPGEGSSDLNRNQWYSVVLEHDGSDLYLYVDGTLNYSVTPVGSGWQTSNTLTVGRVLPIHVTNNIYEWDGQSLDVMLWSRKLNSFERFQLADPSNVSLSGLIRPPKRKLYAVRSTPYSRHYFSFRINGINSFIGVNK